MRRGTLADTGGSVQYAAIQYRRWDRFDTTYILFESKAEADRFLEDLAKSRGLRIGGCLIPYHSIIFVYTKGIVSPGESIVKLV